MRCFLAFAVALAGLVLVAAPAPALGQPVAADRTEDVRAVIDRLFDAMRAGDSAAVRATFAPQMRLMTVAAGDDGAPVVQETPADRFIAAVGAPHDAVWDERIWDVAIRRDRLSHCGTNAIQLAKTGGAWQIVQITDTRRADCDDFVPAAVRAKEP